MNSDPKDPNALPKGNLYREEDLQPAQLIPSGQPGMYNLRFGAIPAGVSGILSTGFAVAPLSCGGQCGGLQVVYSSANAGSKWIAYPDIKYPNGWRVGFLYYPV